MRVDLKIKSIIEQMQGISYEFNNWATANVTFDNLPLPVCLYILPVSGQINLKNDYVRDQPNALIAFLDKAEFDADGEQNEPTVERMKNYAVEFFYRVNQSGQFKPIPDNLPYSVVYDKLDVNVTGVVFSVQLQEQPGVCIENFVNC